MRNDTYAEGKITTNQNCENENYKREINNKFVKIVEKQNER
jgi:hypothetical protein